MDDEGISWITDITGGADMNDELFKAAVYLMVAIGEDWSQKEQTF